MYKIHQGEQGGGFFPSSIDGEKIPRSAKRWVKRCTKLRTALSLAELSFPLLPKRRKRKDFSISHLKADIKKKKHCFLKKLYFSSEISALFPTFLLFFTFIIGFTYNYFFPQKFLPEWKNKQKWISIFHYIFFKASKISFFFSSLRMEALGCQEVSTPPNFSANHRKSRRHAQKRESLQMEMFSLPTESATRSFYTAHNSISHCLEKGRGLVHNISSVLPKNKYFVHCNC